MARKTNLRLTIRHLLILMAAVALTSGGFRYMMPARDVDFRTGQYPSLPIGRAIVERDLTTVKQLAVEAASVFSVPDRYGRTALHWAAIQGDADIVRIIPFSKADVHRADGFGVSSAEYAQCHGRWFGDLLVQTGSRD